MSSDIVLAGRLTADPEIQFLPSGQPVVNFDIAVNERVKNKDTGEWENGDTSFYPCRAFGPMADAFAEELVRGDLFIGQGSIKIRTYEKDGQKFKIPQVTITDGGRSLKWPRKERENTETVPEFDSPPF